MLDLWTASTCLAQLKKDGYEITKGYFSQKVSDGTIPKHKKPNSPKNFHKYSEVVDGLKKGQDPTRDAQRETNSEKRQSSAANDLFNSDNLPKDDFNQLSEADKKKILSVPENIPPSVPDLNDDTDPRDVAKILNVSLADAKKAKEHWLGEKARLEVEEREGKLVSIYEVEKQAFELARSVREAILRIPDRNSAILASITDEHQINMRLTNELIQALEALSE